MSKNSFGPSDASSEGSKSTTEKESSPPPLQHIVEHQGLDQKCLPLVYGMDFTDDSFLVVCIGGHTFKVHRQPLTQCSRTFVQAIDESDGEDFCLQVFSADAFGLFLQWLYTGQLPLQQFDLLPSKYQGPHEEYPPEGERCHFCNLYVKSPFQNVSAEELRLIEYGGQHGLAYLSHVREVYIRNLGPNHATVENHATAEAYLRWSGMNPKSPDSVFREHFVFLTLELAIFAQEWGMNRLHDTAIEAYRFYEHRQARQHPLMQHIHLVYENSRIDSRLRQLMADYAFTACRRSNSRTAILETLVQYPEFLQDLLKRDDSPNLVALSDPLSSKEQKNAYRL